MQATTAAAALRLHFWPRAGTAQSAQSAMRQLQRLLGAASLLAAQVLHPGSKQKHSSAAIAWTARACAPESAAPSRSDVDNTTLGRVLKVHIKQSQGKQVP
jgi:hypothetical protein